MVIRQTECVEELLSAMILMRKFRLRLPHTGLIYNPVYTSALYFDEDIIAFSTDKYPEGYFIARITRKIVRGFVARYNVECILRGNNRDVANKVNWLAKTVITTKMILCKLKPELR